MPELIDVIAIVIAIAIFIVAIGIAITVVVKLIVVFAEIVQWIGNFFNPPVRQQHFVESYPSYNNNYNWPIWFEDKVIHVITFRFQSLECVETLQLCVKF